MNLLHIQYIIETSKHESISKAAEALVVSQSRLSKIIKETEDEINFPIFARTSKGIVLTPRGEEFITQSTKVLYEHNKLLNLSLKSSPIDSLDVSFPRASYLSNALIKFLKSNPSISTLNYHETNSTQILKNVYEGESRLGIIRFLADDFHFYLNQMSHYSLHHQLIADYEYLALMSKDNPLADKDVTSLDLEQQIELQHGDIALKDVPIASINQLNNGNPRHFTIYERGSQFEILKNIHNTYMWVSPMPKNVLEENGLIQKKCLDKHIKMMDFLVIKKGYSPSKTENDLLRYIKEEVNKVF